MPVLWNNKPAKFMGTDATCNEAIIDVANGGFDLEWVQFEELTCAETGRSLLEILKER